MNPESVNKGRRTQQVWVRGFLVGSGHSLKNPKDIYPTCFSEFVVNITDKAIDRMMGKA